MVFNQIVNYKSGTDPLSLVFAALADPTRRAILAQLGTGEATVNELAEPFDMSLPAISKHLKVLEQAGLITRSRKAQYRPCHLDAARLQEATEWLDNYRMFWQTNFSNLDTYLQEIKKNKE